MMAKKETMRLPSTFSFAFFQSAALSLVLSAEGCVRRFQNCMPRRLTPHSARIPLFHGHDTDPVHTSPLWDSAPPGGPRRRSSGTTQILATIHAKQTGLADRDSIDGIFALWAKFESRAEYVFSSLQPGGHFFSLASLSRML